MYWTSVCYYSYESEASQCDIVLPVRTTRALQRRRSELTARPQAYHSTTHNIPIMLPLRVIYSLLLSYVHYSFSKAFSKA
jgi:hypothetical protein